jgi:hypothetical protein
MRDWTGLNWLKISSMAESCKYYNELSASIKGGHFLEQLNERMLLNDPDPSSIITLYSLLVQQKISILCTTVLIWLWIVTSGGLLCTR